MRWRIVRWRLLGCLLLVPAASGYGQTEQAAPKAKPVSDKTEQNYQISERTTRQERNSFGFTLGVLGIYDTNFLGIPAPKEGQAIAALAPKFYTNLRRQNSFLHLDYQLTYRRYPSGFKTYATDHVAAVDYDVRPWRKISFRFSDNLRFGPNDILSSAFGSAPGAGGSPQVFFDQQNMFANSLTSIASLAISRKNRTEVSGSYDLVRFEATPNEGTGNLAARIRHEYQWLRRWFLTGTISNEWVRSNDGLRNGSILRFLAGGAYKPGEGWEISAQAGEDRVHLDSGDSMQPSYRGAVVKESDATRLALQYWHASTYQIGLPGLNESDNVEARFEHRFPSRLSLGLSAKYYRTSGIANIGRIKSVSGRAGFEYAVFSNILFSMSLDYLYQRQLKVTTTDIDLTLDKYMVSLGLYYFRPATKR